MPKQYVYIAFHFYFIFYIFGMVIKNSNICAWGEDLSKFLKPIRGRIRDHFRVVLGPFFKVSLGAAFHTKMSFYSCR